MSFNLNDLLNDLEQSAGIEKQASAEVKPAVSDEFASVLTKKADDELTKVAFAEGEKLAKELLSKLANEIITDNAVMQAQDDTKIVPTETGGTITDVLQGTVNQSLAHGATTDDLVDQAIDKQAEENLMSNPIFNSIMEKIALAGVGEPVTTPAAAINVAGAAVPNEVQMANAVMTAQDDAKVQPLPGAAGTVNNILEAIVASAQAQGAGSDDLVNGEGAQPMNTVSDEVEKAAAVSHLCDEGVSFEDAVSLVKQAEEAIHADEVNLEKKAAFDALTEAGVDFEDAITLIKQAEEDLEKQAFGEFAAARAARVLEEGYGAAKAGAGKVGKVLSDAKYAAGKKAGKVKGYFFEPTGKYTTKGGDITKLNKKRAAIAAGAIGTAGVGGYALSKKAAFDELIESGVDFDQAVELVKQAADYEGQARRIAGEVVPYTGTSVARRVQPKVNPIKGVPPTFLKNPLVRGAGAVAALGTAAYAGKKIMEEKRAAFDALVEAGVDFEDAVNLVKAAEQEVYGQ